MIRLAYISLLLAVSLSLVSAADRISIYDAVDALENSYHDDAGSENSSTKSTRNLPRHPISWEYLRSKLPDFNLEKDDTVYISMIEIQGFGERFYGAIVKSRHHNYLISVPAFAPTAAPRSKRVTCVPLSHVALSRIGDAWNPDSALRIDKRYHSELIFDASHSFTTAARIILKNGIMRIDTVSYNARKSAKPFIDIFQKGSYDAMATPYQGVYDALFDEYLVADDSSRYSHAEGLIDKSDFVQLWKRLEIMFNDTLYVSIFKSLNDDTSTRTVLLQDSKRRIWGRNQLPNNYSLKDRTDGVYFFETPLTIGRRLEVLRDEPWDTTYRHIKLTHDMPIRQISNGKRPYFVRSARIIINGSKFSIDTMGYTANIRIPTLIDNNYR